MRTWMIATAVGLALVVVAAPVAEGAGSSSAEVKRLEKRVKLQQKTIRARNADLAEARATISATWAAIGETLPQYRPDTLESAVAGVQAQLAAVQGALAGAVTTQIAAFPATSNFSSVLSALCTRARAGGTGWACSTYFATGYSSYDFTR